MEGKDKGLGIGVVLLALAGLFFWSKKKPAEAARKVEVPPELVGEPMPTLPIARPSSLVETEELVTDPIDITVALNALGVQAPANAEDIASTLSEMAAAGIDVSGGISEEDFREYFQEPAAEAIGLTMEEIPAYSEVADEVNLSLGGSYVAGYLTPPSSWTGSVTEWSRYIQEVALIEYNRLKVEATKPAPAPAPASAPTPTPAPAPAPEPVKRQHYSVTYLDGTTRTISWVSDPVSKPNLWDFVDRDKLSSWTYLGLY